MYSTSCQNFIENDPELSPAILVFCGHPVPHMEMGQPPMNQTSLRLQLKLFLNEFMTRCMGFINSNRKVPPPPLFIYFSWIFGDFVPKKLFRKGWLSISHEEKHAGEGGACCGIRTHVLYTSISWFVPWRACSLSTTTSAGTTPSICPLLLSAQRSSQTASRSAHCCQMP